MIAGWLAAVVIVLGMGAWIARANDDICEWEDETEAWINQGRG